MIAFKNVFKTFDHGKSFAVKDLSLTINTGETLVLLGSSGSGKTTTLKMINRLIEPSSGKIEVGNQDVMKLDPVKLRRRIGYVFQGIGLFPHMTVEQNVALVPRLLGRSAKDEKTHTQKLLELVGLSPEGHAHRFPGELDGEVDAICAFTTDGRIASYGLKPLHDDRGFFPPYHAVPVVRKRCLDDNAELSEVLSSLKGVLNDETMQQLNVQVDEKGFTPAEVAKGFLKSGRFDINNREGL